MDQHNGWLTTELTRQRYDGLRREAEHERLLAEHGLDLVSVLRRAIAERLPRRSVLPAETITTRGADEDSRTSIAA